MSDNFVPQQLPKSLQIKIIAIGLFGVIANINNWILLPVAPFLISHFYDGIDPRLVGYRTGWFTTMFAIGSIVGKPILDRIAPLIGRRLILILGLVVTALCTWLFALSPNYHLALLVRLLWGLLCGNINIARELVLAVVSSSVPRSEFDSGYENDCMNYWLQVSGMGRIIGPLLAGILWCPSIFCELLGLYELNSFPLVITSVVYTALCVLVALVGIFGLVMSPGIDAARIALLLNGNTAVSHSRGSYEKLQAHETTAELDHVDASGSLDNLRLNTVDVRSHGFNDNICVDNNNKGAQDVGKMDLSPPSRISLDDLEIVAETGDKFYDDILPSNLKRSFSASSALSSRPSFDSNNRDRRSKGRVSFNSKVLVKVIGDDSDKLHLDSLRQVSSDEKPLGLSSVPSDSLLFEDQLEEANDADVAVWNHSPIRTKEPNGKGETVHAYDRAKSTSIIRYTNGSEFSDLDLREATDGSFRLLLDPTVFTCCLLHGIIGFLNVSLIEAFPLWLALPGYLGGFGANPAMVGISFAMLWPTYLFVHFYFYSFLASAMPLKTIFRIGIIAVWVIVLICSGFSMLMIKGAVPSVLHWIAITFIFLVVFASIQVSQSTLNTFTSNSCYSHERALVISLGQKFAAVGKITAPVFSSSIFASSQSNNKPWPFNEAAIWNISGGICILILFLSTCFNKKIHRTRREPTVPRYAVTMGGDDTNESTKPKLLASEVDGMLELVQKF